MQALVIQEFDPAEGEQIIIGVADSLENAEDMIQEYYGDHEVLETFDTGDFGIDYHKILSVENYDKTFYKVEVMVHWFELNKV